MKTCQKCKILFTQCSFVFFSVKYSEKNNLFLKKKKIQKKQIEKKCFFFSRKNNSKSFEKKNTYGEKNLMRELDLTVYINLCFFSAWKKSGKKNIPVLLTFYPGSSTFQTKKKGFWRTCFFPHFFPPVLFPPFFLELLQNIIRKGESIKWGIEDCELILNAQSSIPNLGFGIKHWGLMIDDCGLILNPQSSILNPQSSILNPQSSIHSILNP